jgi:hypothetical protein
MKVKKEDIITLLLAVIVVVIVARRFTSSYNVNTPAADLLIRPVNIGKDIVLTDAKWTNTANYKPGDAGDENLPWYDINTKAWSVPNCWGFRKVLQKGGGGSVGYFLTDPSGDMSRDCGVIDTTVLSDGVEYSIPDAFISQISAADPVQGTDCVWTLGAGSKWIVGSPAVHGGACSPAPPPVGFVNATFFNTKTPTLPNSYYVFIGANGRLGWSQTLNGSYDQTNTGNINFRVLIKGTDGKFYGLKSDGTGILSSTSIFGPWSVVRPINTSFRWINQLDDGTCIGINSTDNGIYTSSTMAGPWTRQGAQTVSWGPIASADGATLIAIDTSGTRPRPGGALITATSIAGPWTTYTDSPMSQSSPLWWAPSFPISAYTASSTPAASPSPAAAPSPSSVPPKPYSYSPDPETVLPLINRAYKLKSGKWIAIQPNIAVCGDNNPGNPSSACDAPGCYRLFYSDSPAGPWTWDKNWRLQGSGCNVDSATPMMAMAAFEDPDTSDLIIIGGHWQARDRIYKTSSPVTWPTKPWTQINPNNVPFVGVGKVSPTKRLFLEYR